MPGTAVAQELSRTVRAAVRRNGVGDFDGAVVLLADGLEIAETLPPADRDFWRSRLLVTLSYATFETRGNDAATAQLDEARSLAEAIGSRRLEALTYVQEANLRARGTAWQAAVRAGTAAGGFTDVLEPEELFALHLNRGFAHMGVLHLDESERDVDAALALADREGAEELRYKAIHNRGCLAYVRGDLPRALALMREADELPVEVARDRNRLDQAQVLLDAGLVERARTVLEEALAGAERANHLVQGGAVRLDLARCAVLLGEIDQARDHAEAALHTFEGLGATQRSRRARLVLAQVALLGDDDALDPVELMLEGWAPDSVADLDAQAATRLRAELALRQGRTQECLDLLGQLAPGPRSVEARLHEDYLHAAASAALGDHRSSRTRCRSASMRLARQQGRSQSLEVRAAMAVHARRLASFDVEEALRTGRPSSIFASVERWRAASQRIPSVLPSGDARTAELMSELRAAKQARSVVARASRSALDTRIAELTRRVERREWERRTDDDPAAGATPVSTARALALTGPDRVVVSLFAAGEDLHAVVIGTRLTHHLVGRLAPVLDAAAILVRDVRARAVSRRVPALASALDAAVADSARRLDDLLLGPAGGLAALEAADVVVVPTRALASVPWNVLPSLRGHGVVVVRSVTRWVHSSQADLAAPDVAVAVGPGLAHALDEARRIREAWGSSPSGPDVSTAAEAVLALETGTLVHLAAHGVHEEANPMFSTLRMADGPLFLHELPRPLRAEHVILAACDVGRVKVRHGEEALGMSAGLLTLGAHSVLASVAPVDDEATGAAMVCYHEHLAAGRSAARALAATIAEHPTADTFCLYGADCAAEPAEPMDPARRVR